MGRAVAILIWLVALAPIALSPLSQYQPPSSEMPHAVVLLPAVFFPAAAFFIGGYPFDVKLLREWIDKRLGANTYTGFIRQLKPMLLFGVTALATSTLGFFEAFRIRAPTAAYWDEALAFSAGIGFLLARLVLARRGLLMESRPMAAAWANREFLPQSVRRLRATYITALFAGAWTAFGMSTMEALRPSVSVPAYNNIFLASSVFFFVIPVFLLVFGVQSFRQRTMGRFSSTSLKQWARALVRVFCWMLAAVFFSMIFGAIRAHLLPLL